jgi:hypothetical protein
MTPSSAKVIVVKVLVVDVRHGACAKAIGVISSKISNATTAKATQVSSTKATDVASAKAHAATMSSAKAAHTTTMSSAAPGLCAGRKQAPSERCARQNCYHSSFHDILHLDGRIFHHRSLLDVGVSRLSERQGRDRMEMRVLSRRLQ